MFSQTQPGTQSAASTESSSHSGTISNTFPSPSTIMTNPIAQAHAVLLMGTLNFNQQQAEVAEFLKKTRKRQEELTAKFEQLVQNSQIMANVLAGLNKRMDTLEQNQSASLSGQSRLSSSSYTTASSTPGIASLQTSTIGSTSTHPMAEATSQPVSSTLTLLSSQSSSSSSADNSHLNSSWFFGSENLSPSMRFTSTTTQTTVTNLMFPPNCFFNESEEPINTSISPPNSESASDQANHKRLRLSETPNSN